MELKIENKVDILNVIRCVAILSVFMLHAKLFSPGDWYLGIHYPWLTYTPAWAAVWIFFLLSGYGIGYGFNFGKYSVDGKGILRFYISRLKKIIPIYYFYLLIVLIFITPEYLIPARENFYRILSLLCFNYNSSFGEMQFGAIWYLTALMKLYLVAPFIHIFFSKFAQKPCLRNLSIIVILGAGLLLRLILHYDVDILGNGEWGADIYRPFYMNLDIFIVGYLLNYFKKEPIIESKRVVFQIGKTCILLGFFLLIFLNNYIYLHGEFYGNINYMVLYKYIFPTIYVLIISAIIYLFEIKRDYKRAPLSMGMLKQNPLRIFDYATKIILPFYLFHSSIFYVLKNAITLEYVHKIRMTFELGLTDSFVFMLVLMILGFVLTLIVAIAVFNGTKHLKHTVLNKLITFVDDFRIEKRS